MSDTEGAMHPSEPLPSATVVLVRDGAAEPELLLVRRHARTSFGATYVFPGGILGPDDTSVEDRCTGIEDGAASRVLELPRGGIAYFSAAIRELFEEAGVLLARTASGRFVDPAPLDDHREPLNDGRESWSAFLERYDLRLACDVMHYFSFWITPRELAKRFSTRFFAAEMPAGQIASHCGTEVTDSRWVSAREALEQHNTGDIELPHPTVVTLGDLERFTTTRAILDWARKRSRDGVPCLLPAVVVDGGERRVLMPGDPGYPAYGDVA